MKKWSAIVAIVGFAIFAVGNLVHDFITSDPIAYFSRDPVRLLYVAGIAVAGGLVTLGYYKLPPRIQRRARMLGLGMAGSATASAACYFVYVIFSLASIISSLGGSAWSALVMLPMLLLFSAITAYCWFKCWRVWQTETV